MSVVNDVLLQVVNLMQQTNPYSAIVIGAMPAENGIACQISTGAPVSTFLDKGMAYQFNLVLNGKHSEQQTVSETLNNIHHALVKARSYPSTEEYQITNIETISAPAYISREENKQYLYGSSLRVSFYYR